MEYQYIVRSNLMLPPRETRRNPNSLKMDCDDMESELNRLGSLGWELVTYGATHWIGEDVPQQWWVFKKPLASDD